MKARLKNYITLALISMLALVVLDYFLPMDRVLGLVLDARPEYLVFAGTLVAAGILVNAYVYRVLLRTFGYSVGFTGLVAATLKSRFVGNTVPTLGVSALAVLDYYFKSKDIDSKVSKRVLILKNVANVISSIIILVVGFLLFVRADVSRRALIVPGILTVVVLAGFIYTAYLVTEIRRLRGMVRLLESLFGRLVSPAGPRLRGLAEEIADGVRYARENKAKLVIPVLCNLTGTALLAVTVYMIFLAMATEITLGSVVVGFITATWIGSVSMLPGGVGAFEATMTASYRGVGIGIEEVAAVVLMFRVISFWIPTAAGGILVRKELRDIRGHIKKFIAS